MLSLLLSTLEAGRDSIIHWQREMTARPALGPENEGQGEHEKALWLIEEMQRLNLPNIQEFPAEDSRVQCGSRPNLVAHIQGKSSQTLWIIGHLDIVPPGEISLWHSSPYELRVDGDLIYGRGVEDNQQAIATGLLIADALVKTATIPTLSLGLLFVADEETGMARGLPHILKAAPDLIKHDDLLVVPDMGDSTGSMVQIAEKSCLWLKFTILGRQSHASTPDVGINSLVVCSECILALKELYRRFRNKNKLFSPSWSTFVPTKKESNVLNINTLPGKDVFYLDCRLLPEYEPADVITECNRIVEPIMQKYKTSITIEAVHTAPAATPTPQDAPVVKSLMQAITEETGAAATVYGSGGQTVASILRNSGYTAAAWSTLIPNAHSPNEHSSITNTIKDAKILTRMLFS